MPLLAIVLAILIVGALVYMVNNYLPLDPTIKKIFNAVVIIALVVWLLKVFGLWAYLSTIRV